MSDIAQSFSAENGFSLNDEVGILTGTIDPSIDGVDAPIGSVYLRQNGQAFQKTGPAVTNWVRFTQGLGEGIKITANDTAADFLNAKLLVTAHLTKTVENPAGIENLLLDLSNTGVTAGTYRSVTVDAKGRVTAGTNPTTLSGYGITDAQPLDADLTAIAGLSTVGYLTRTGPNTWATRTFQGTTNQIALTNGSGGIGNTTLSFPTTNLTFPGTQGVILPRGTTAQRVNTAATLRYNNDTNTLEYFNASTWVPLVASTGGTVTSIDITPPPFGITIIGGPVTTSGTFTVALANDLAGVEALTGVGFAARTAPDAWALRSVFGTADRLTVTNGDGTSGDPTLDIASTYIGQSSITTLGTIGTGTWQASVIDTQYGGTGRSTIGGANQLLGVNTTATGLEYKTLQSGTAISVVATGGTLTVNNTGVTSLAGTTNRVSVSSATGAVTLTLPQDIHAGATPTFAQVAVAANPTTALQVATKQYVDNLVAGLNPKQSVRAATTSNITLSGTQTVDGIALSAGDRVLVKNQTVPAENGIYVVGAGTWTRASDLDAWEEVPGCFVFVEEGTTQADTAWLSTADQGGTLGTTAITWVAFASAADLTAGTGLTKTGNTFSITNVGTPGTYNSVTTNAQGQVVSGSNVGYLTANQTITLAGDITGTGSTLINTTLANSGVAAGTYRSVTVDAKGRVTSGTNPTTLAGYGITDAQPLDGDLTSLAALTTTGILVRSGTNTILTRSLAAGSSRITITNADGVSNNPSIDVAEANLVLNNIGGTLGVSKGGTGLSAPGTANQFLSTNAAGTALEYRTFTAGTGISITPAAGSLTIAATNNGTVTSVAVAGSTGLGVTGSPITSAGTITLTLASELQGLSLLSANGLVARTATGTYASRSVVSGAGTISITNPAGTAGNIGIDLTTVGTPGTYRSVTTDLFGRVTAGTNPTTLAGYGITDAVSTSQLGAANGVATLDASGLLPVSQLPPLAINSTSVVTSEAAMLALTAQVGDMAVRTDVNRTFVLAAEPATVLANWVQLADGPSGTVTSVGLIAPAAGITVSGSPITTSGSFTLALANDLAAVENLATNGIAVRTGTSTWATRTLVAGSGISITNPDGVAGNITISASGGGTVTSVGLSLPSIFSVTGSPITTAGTISATLNSQAAGTVFAGPTTGSAAPTFRTLSIDELNDVTITAPQNNQVLAYNSGTSQWVNAGAVGSAANGLVGVGQAGAAAWTLISGNSYRADFAHNLGTTNVVITVFDSTTNVVVIPASITLLNTNTVRIQVTGNTRTLRVVVVANGQAIVAGGSTPSSVIVAKDGVDVVTATRVNFVGQATNVTSPGGGTAQVTIGSRFSYFANSLDTPNSADWAVNSLAPATADPSFSSLNVRSFSNTVEQGVGFTVSIPPGATTLTIKLRGRAQVAQGTAQVVQPRLYHRLLPPNGAVGAWSAAQELANISVPANAFFQYAQQTIALSTLGVTADRLYQFELTRRVAGVVGTNLATPFLLAEVTVEFA